LAAFLRLPDIRLPQHEATNPRVRSSSSKPPRRAASSRARL
jgi:hypothetical protein